MKKTVLTLSALVLFGMLYSCRQQPKTEKEIKPVTEPVKEEITVKGLEPDDSFYRAEVAYIDQEYEQSAADILNGVEFMKKLLPFSKPDQKSELQHSIDELTDFARDVKADKVSGYQDFEYFFARAGKALCAHHIYVSESIAGEGNNDIEAAKNLLKAIHYLRSAYVKSETGLTKDEQASLEYYKKFAKRIIRKDDMKDIKDVKKVFKDAFTNINSQLLLMGES